MSRRALIALLVILAGLATLAAGLAWVLDTPRPAAGAGRGERLYLASCVHCHGPDGRGSWQGTLFLIRPGDLADPERMRQTSDAYLAEIIKHGGSPLGRPGMPGFPHLSDEDVGALVRYLRALSTGSMRSSTSASP